MIFPLFFSVIANFFFIINLGFFLLTRGLIVSHCPTSYSGNLNHEFLELLFQLTRRLSPFIHILLTASLWVFPLHYAIVQFTRYQLGVLKYSYDNHQLELAQAPKVKVSGPQACHPPHFRHQPQASGYDLFCDLTTDQLAINLGFP